MEFEFTHLRWKVDGTIATVWLARPPVNAVNREMYEELQRLFRNIDRLGADIRAVVLAGDGKHFCAGNELDEFEVLTPDNSREHMFHAREAFWSIRDCAVPVIGAVHGVALGTGLAIASSCDFIIASDDARFGLPEIKVGVMGGGKHLFRLLPQGLSRWMFFSGEAVPADELARFGAVLRVVPRDGLMGAAREAAEVIASHSPVALRTAKRSLNTIEYMSLKPGYEFEQSLTTELSAHPDSKEALRASREGRSPVFGPAVKS